MDCLTKYNCRIYQKLKKVIKQNVRTAGKHFSKILSILRTEISKHTKSHLDLQLFRKEIFTEFPFHLEWRCNFYLMEKKKKTLAKTTKKVNFFKN